MNTGKIIKVEQRSPAVIPPGEYLGYRAGYTISIPLADPIKDGAFTITTERGIRGLERVKVSVSESGEITTKPI